jgi:hypothetical protein
MTRTGAKSRSTLLADAGKVAVLIGAMWAFSVAAARDVMNPHIATAKAKAALMCELAKYVADSAEKTCIHVGASCPRPAALGERAIDAACKD